MAGGITFGVAKSRLRISVDGGVGPTNSRVMDRTNEAQELILSKITPVNGMMSAVVTTDATGIFLLPPEIENVIDAVVLATTDQEVSQQYFTEITNPFTYLDPSVAKDSPLIDYGLVPDPGPPANPAVLRRKYQYPGLDQSTQIQVTGDKSFVPITSDDDYLIVQNIPALQIALEAITLRWANAPEEQWQGRLASAISLLQDEVKKHMMDRRNFMRRRADYERDLLTFRLGTKGWVRARIALEQPGAMLMGKSELGRLLDRSEMELLDMGDYKGSLEEVDATVYGGELSFPPRVMGIVDIRLCGFPIDIRSIHFTYLKNGGWHACDTTCGGFVRDLGDEDLDGSLPMRKYWINGSVENGQTMRAVCKLRWVPKGPDEFLTIRNLLAHRAMIAGFILEQAGDIAGLENNRERAKQILDSELDAYLRGVKPAMNVIDEARSMEHLGYVL